MKGKTKYQFNDLGIQKVKQNEFHAFDIVLDPSQKRSLKPKQSKSLITILALGILVLVIGVVSFHLNNDTEIKNAEQIIAESDRPMVLVMPFENRSGNKSDDQLSSGMTDIIISSLASHPRLLVQSSSTSNFIEKKGKSDNEIKNEYFVNYVMENNYFEDQKKKIGIDKYFSDLKSGKPQIFGLYWSKAQSEIRHSKEMETVKKWLNNLWNYNYEGKNVFDPNRELVYADRVRRREPGDDTLGLSPHCDAGSIERWTDKAYQKIYNDIFSDNFENFNPYDARYRDETIEFESPAVAHVFRTFQGWTALTEQGPSDGTLQLSLIHI